MTANRVEFGAMAKKNSAKGQDGGLTAEVLIVGGGLAGLTQAIALAGAGIETLVVDRADPALLQAAAHDGRSSAIARGSSQMLAVLGIWERMAAQAQPIMDIRVSDGRVGRAAAPLFLHFAQENLDAETAGPLGYIVENRVMREALHARAAEIPALELLAPASIAELRRDPGAAVARLEDGRELRTQLVIAADGRNSQLRAAAGIETTKWDYPQCGIVATLHHDKPHHAMAFEHFLPAGPFAVLPMTDTHEGQHRSSLVWTEKRELVPAMMALSDDAFSAELMRRFAPSLGDLRAVGGRWSYPLSLLFAERIVDHRLALVGDAAHGIHPISGQGLNLGLRDAAALAEILVEARRLGLDLGGAEVLAGYPRWRRFDNLALIAVTDSLNRLFSNDIGPIRLARDLGLAAVNQVPPLKRLFMRHAMGLVGDLPKLVRGEAL